MTEEEIKLIRATFSDEEILKKIRAIMLGFEVSKTDEENIKGIFKNPEILRIFRGRFLPEINPDAKIGTVLDMWIGAEEGVYNKDKDTRKQAVGYKVIAIKRMEDAIDRLVNGGEPTDIRYKPEEDDELNLNLLARNLFIRGVENNLLQLFVMAQEKKEDAEAIAKRLNVNSNK